MQFNRININQGLPSNHVSKIFEQSTGHIWFATDAGVARFDGKQFIHYKQQNNEYNQLSNNVVTALAEDNEGNIWIATEFGLNRLCQEGKIKQYFHSPSKPNSLPDNWVTDLFFDSHDNLWVGTGQGISRFNPESDSFDHKPLIIGGKPTPKSIWKIIESPSGELIVSASYRLFLLDSNDSSFQLFEPKNDLVLSSGEKSFTAESLSKDVYYLYFDSQNRLWLNSGDYGLYSFAQTNSLKNLEFSKAEYHQTQAFEKLYESAPNDIWILGYDKLSLYNPVIQKHKVVEKILHDEHSLPSNIVTDIIRDKHQGLWIATENGIAYRSADKKSTHFYSSKLAESSVIDDDIVSIEVDKDMLWLSSSNAIERLHIASWSADSYPNQFLKSGVKQVSVAKNGETWFATNDGLIRFTPKTGQFTRYSNGPNNPYKLPNSSYFTVLADNNGGVWFTGHVNVGLQYFNAQTLTRKSFLNEGNPYSNGGNYSYKTVFDGRGNIWLATTAGVFFFDVKTEQYQQIIVAENEPNTRVNDITIGPDGHAWAATNGYGIIKIAQTVNGFLTTKITDSFTHASDVTRSLAFDKKGNLWFTGTNVVYQYKPANNELTLFSSLTTGLDHFFRVSAIAMYQDSLFLGASTGLISIKLSEIETTSPKLPTYINSVSTINRVIDLAMIQSDYPKIELKGNEKSLTINFSSPNYSAPDHMYYRYKLIGYDEDWRTTSLNQTEYGGLPFGQYTFVVESRNNNGEWIKHDSELTISIAIPWWVHFLTLCFAIIFLLCFAIYKYRKISISELKLRANYDSLTGLINRYYFNQTLDQRFETQPLAPFAIFFIDMDHFKSINDSYGHSVGDEFIITTARRLARNVKKTDTLCRLSGDEFAIIIDGYHKADELQDIAKRLNSALSIPIQIEQHHIKSSASIGVACYPHDGDDRQKLLTNADIAMYKAKESGRNQTSFYDQKLGSKLAELRYISAQLNNGIENNEFLLHYQPKVCSKTGYVVGFESLVRWQHPERGMIRPDLFINEAEKNGAIIELGYWILKEAMTTASHWDRKGLLKGSVAVNISPVQINHPGLIDKIKALLVETELAPEKLELEITENVFINNLNHAKRVLNEISKLGIKIALDDFGSGFSSLSYLTQLPLNTLKVDKYMVDQLDKTEQASVVLKGIFELGHGLGLQMVAEGVEQVEQLNFIRNFGEPLIQGYFFSKPVDKEHANLLLGKCYYPLTVDGKYLA